jgi:undecaprenyl pyrophosphate synthase
MRVISAGQTTWSAKVTCSKCRAHLEVKTADLHKSSREWGGSRPSERYTEPYYYAVCPTSGCHNHIEVSMAGANEYVMSQVGKDRYEGHTGCRSSLAAQIDAVERDGCQR